jgi:two-component system, NarL family, response regulator LiaR
VRGLANQQIADETEVTLPTVKFHITNILSKLHVESRTQAVLQALRFRIVDSP